MTARNFRTRYEEDISNIRYNKDKSRYDLHILQHKYEYGPIKPWKYQ
jgi:hypothetical protein